LRIFEKRILKGISGQKEREDVTGIGRKLH
jgi:hypothetical protein